MKLTFTDRYTLGEKIVERLSKVSQNPNLLITRSTTVFYDYVNKEYDIRYYNSIDCPIIISDNTKIENPIYIELDVTMNTIYFYTLVGNKGFKQLDYIRLEECHDIECATDVTIWNVGTIASKMGIDI